VGVLLWLKRTLTAMLVELSPPPFASLQQIRADDPDALPPYVKRPPLKSADRHQALFPLKLRHRGPEWMCHIVRTVLLTNAVYVIGLQSIFGAKMLQQPGVLGPMMIVAALLSVLIAMYLLLPLLPLLITTQSIGMMKKEELVNKTFRQQKLNLSLRLLKLLTSLQAQARHVRKLRYKTVSGADEGQPQQTAEEIHREQELAMEVLNKYPHQKKELEDAFKLFDTTNDNNIDTFELKGLLHSMGQKVTDAEAQQLLNEMDADNSGSISLEEFLTVMASEVSEEAEEQMPLDELCDSMFDMLDHDKSGFVTFTEFRAELSKLPTGMEPEEIDELLQEMFGGDGDTHIDRHEFKHFVESHSAMLI